MRHSMPWALSIDWPSEKYNDWQNFIKKKLDEELFFLQLLIIILPKYKYDIKYEMCAPEF